MNANVCDRDVLLKRHALVPLVLLSMVAVAHPNAASQSNPLNNLMQKLQKLQPQQSAQTSAGTGKAGGMVTSSRWCQQQAGALGRMQIDTSVIASEFKVTELDTLQDQFRKAFFKGPINKTFPGPGFFRASFETAKVRAIYDTFLAFPEPDTLAALIQLSRGADAQERGDGLMALTFLHLQASELSVNPDRWWQLFQSALGVEHYTALVFRARLNAYGEYGPKNLGQALGDLQAAGSLPSKYRVEGRGNEFDPQNYQTLISVTALDIFRNEPNAPYRQQWAGPAQMAQQILQAQQAFERKLPSTRIGRMYAEANRLNRESIAIGDEIIRRSQGGNQLLGQLEGLKSLRSVAPGDKPVFEDVSSDVQAEQLKMFAKLDSLDGEQKQLLSQAQEKRLIAQGTVAQTYAELMQALMSGMGDMVKMAAPLPALSQANNALIQSCMISAKWEHAMRARDVPKPDIKKTESSVADLQSKFKD